MICKCKLSEVCKYRDPIIDTVRKVLYTDLASWDMVSDMIQKTCHFRKPDDRGTGKKVVVGVGHAILKLKVSTCRIARLGHNYPQGTWFLAQDEGPGRFRVARIIEREGEFYHTEDGAITLPMSDFESVDLPFRQAPHDELGQGFSS